MAARPPTTRSCSTSCCRASTGSRPAGACATRRVDAGAHAHRARRRSRTAWPASTPAPTTTWSSRSPSPSCSPGCARWPGAGRSSAPRCSRGRPTLDPATAARGAATTEIALSAKEFALLEAFMRRPGEVLTRFELLERVWDGDYENRSNIVDVYVALPAREDRPPVRRRVARDGPRRGLPACGPTAALTGSRCGSRWRSPSGGRWPSSCARGASCSARSRGPRPVILTRWSRARLTRRWPRGRPRRARGWAPTELAERAAASRRCSTAGGASSRGPRSASARC